MKKIYQNPSPQIVKIMSDVLKAHGINFQVKNLDLQSLSGELPFMDISPSIWVAPEDVDKALKALHDSEPTDKLDWTCPGCQEKIEASFTACWNCGQEKN